MSLPTTERFTLANRDHLGLFVGIMLAMGAVCSECGHGTRRTSKRWAKCRACGARVRYRTRDEMERIMEANAERNGRTE